MIILSVILGVIGYFLLILLTTNLTGMVVRGLFRDAEIEEMRCSEETSDFIRKQINNMNRWNNIGTIAFAIILFSFLYLLYRYIGVWSLISALLLITARIPGLLWEIKYKKRTRPQGIINVLAGLMAWLALPALWWALYNLLC